MAWQDRIHKKRNMEKSREKLKEDLISELLNHPRYQEVKENIRSEAVLDAFCACCIASSEYLEEKHRYGKNGILNFLDFMSDRLSLMGDSEYILKRVEHHKIKYDLDIPKEMNVEFDVFNLSEEEMGMTFYVGG